MKTCFRLLPLVFVATACGASQPAPGVAAVSVSTPGGPAAPAGSAVVVEGGLGLRGAPPPGSPPPPGGAPRGAAPAAAAEPPPPEHPFAATASDATSLIDAAIDSRASSLFPCVIAARGRRKNPHDKIQIEVGLDEQGHLMGVEAPRGAPKDPELFQCAQKALSGANFPTSHAGIITVTKTFEDQAVYK